jgi:hypothetical protein
MRIVRYSILTLAAIGLALGFGANALAFHGGGVAECVGCHSMHTPFPDGNALLIGGDPSATCLACHQSAGDTSPSSYHISTPDTELVDGVSPVQRTPGGDFGWLHKTYTWAGRRGATEIEWGYTHGHNIVAGQGYDRDGNTVNYNYTADPHNTMAPGGGESGYPSADLGCVSCHDPHGTSRRNLDGSITGPAGGNPISASGSYNNTAVPTDTTSVGVYRLLAGPGYTTDGVEFTGAPDAVAPSSYNRSEETNQVKVAYGRNTASGVTGHVTWSAWCGTCHGEMHWDFGANYTHPTDMPLLAADAANYNKYVKTGDLTGNVATSFTSLVPFVYNTAEYEGASGLKAFAGNDSPTYRGPSNNDRVDCVTCHRAHASAWEYGARWNLEYEFLTTSSGTYYNNTYGSRGRTSAEVQDSYYDRPASVFAPSQRQLCNKCHIKD